MRQRRCAEFPPTIIEMKLHHARRNAQNRGHFLHRLSQRRPSEALPFSERQHGIILIETDLIRHSGFYVSMVGKTHYLQQIF